MKCLVSILNAEIFAMIKLIENILFINVTKSKEWDFVTKIVMAYWVLWKKNVCTSDREKLLKFEAEGQSDFLKKYLAISPGNQIQKYIIYKCY